jgi:hypothetical protein
MPTASALAAALAPSRVLYYVRYELFGRFRWEPMVTLNVTATPLIALELQATGTSGLLIDGEPS